MNQSIGNPLVTYSVTPVDGLEDISTLTHFQNAVVKYMLDTVKREPGYEEGMTFPDNWKYLLSKWVKPLSRASNILDRPDYKTPAKFCEILISRKTSKSEKFDDKLRTFLVSLANPKSMDQHVKIIYDFLELFWDKYFTEKFLIHLTEQFDTSFNTVTTNGSFKGGIAQAFGEARTSFLRKSLASLKDEFMTIFLRHFMMAMVAADGKLFALLENSQMPLTADPSDFADWIQEKICDANNSNIFLTLSTQSPLVSLKNSTYGAISSNTTPRITTSSNTTAAGNTQKTGSNQSKKTHSSGSPGIVGPPQKIVKYNNNSAPHGGRGGLNPAPVVQKKQPGNRYCKYCFDHWSNVSISHTLHDPPFCKRDPGSPKYDPSITGNPPF